MKTANAKRKDSANSLAMMVLKGRTFIVLIVLVIFFSFITPNFFTVNTALMIAKHVALFGILGIGMTYVVITGGIDLSVGGIRTFGDDCRRSDQRGTDVADVRGNHLFQCTMGHSFDSAGWCAHRSHQRYYYHKV